MTTPDAVDRDGSYISGAIVDAVRDALADAPTVYVIVNGTFSDGTISGTVLLASGELLWEATADDLDNLKTALVFDDPVRLGHLIGLYPGGFRVEVIEGELPAWLAEANREFVEASGLLPVADDPLGVGRTEPCPWSATSDTGDPECLDDCPVCDGTGWIQVEVTR